MGVFFSWRLYFWLVGSYFLYSVLFYQKVKKKNSDFNECQALWPPEFLEKKGFSWGEWERELDTAFNQSMWEREKQKSGTSIQGLQNDLSRKEVTQKTIVLLGIVMEEGLWEKELQIRIIKTTY